MMCCLVCSIAAVVWALFVGIHVTLRQWDCDPRALNSTFGEQLFPANFTLADSLGVGAFSSFWYGANLNVLQGIGAAQGLGADLRLIGFFCEVWAWPGQAYGYVESTPEGLFLRFKASRPWHWFLQAPPWTLEPCSAQAGPEGYQIQRSRLFDGSRHDIFRVGPGGERLDVAVAEHVGSDVAVGSSLLAGTGLNLQWRLIFKAPSPHSTTLLAEARQWIDRRSPAAVVSGRSISNWAVGWVADGERLPQAVAPLPGSAVAFTAALYDLTVGISRRRRAARHTGSGGGEGGSGGEGFGGVASVPPALPPAAAAPPQAAAAAA